MNRPVVTLAAAMALLAACGTGSNTAPTATAPTATAPTTMAESTGAPAPSSTSTATSTTEIELTPTCGARLPAPERFDHIVWIWM
ncbi:MAG: hypothetical protein RLZ14_427, partial [Actinomycetota bacterium]